MDRGPLLISVPNVSEGRDERLLEAIERAFGPARFLDLHADPDHNRSVYTLAARQGDLAEGLVSGARAVVERVDVGAGGGVHPHVGALDVMPVVYLTEAERGAACAEALTAAARIGEELDLPVILYGELATRPEHAERAWLREGGPARLAERIEAGEIRPDFGPTRAHPTAGVLLAAARPPLVAFNVDLATGDVELARTIAAEIRESNGGLAGVRAIGLHLEQRGRAQVSTNVHDHRATPLREIVAAVRARAPIAEAELVGLAPQAAFDGFPADVPPARLLAGQAPARERVTLTSPSGAEQEQASPQAPRHGGGDDRAGGTHRPSADARGGQADRPRAPRRAARQAADLARLGQPRRDRRARLRRADRRSVRPAGGDRAEPRRR